jgi:hypothetical protein
VRAANSKFECCGHLGAPSGTEPDAPSVATVASRPHGHGVPFERDKSVPLIVGSGGTRGRQLIMLSGGRLPSFSRRLVRRKPDRDRPGWPSAVTWPVPPPLPVVDLSPYGRRPAFGGGTELAAPSGH